MKRFTLVAAAAMMAMGASADITQLNNPVGADGRYIFKWDCAKGAFAEANDFEVDETVTLAFDVTGTPYATWLAAAPTAEGATRGLALNHGIAKDEEGVGFDIKDEAGNLVPKEDLATEIDGNARRLMKIEDNIYGITVNIAQQVLRKEVLDVVTTKDAITYVTIQLFGFEYTDENPGANWWMWPTALASTPTISPSDDAPAVPLVTLPYTGEKTGEEFISGDEGAGYQFAEAYGKIPGWGAPCCAFAPSAVENVIVNAADVVAIEYYNVLGARLAEVPANGLYIKTSVLSNGKRVSEKVLVK